MKVVPWLRHLVANLSPEAWVQSQHSSSGFKADIVALGQGLL